MKKILILLFFVFILSGCATYKFQKPDSAKAQGYLVSYNDKPLLEYTVGKDNSLPDLTLAQERFKRRRSEVEYYYKKMGQIESRLKEAFWNPPAMMVDFLGGVLRWPFVAVADYKYNRNPKYKERVDKLDEQSDELEKARVNALKEKLNLYINEDLAKESLPQPQPQTQTQTVIVADVKEAVVAQQPVEVSSIVLEDKPIVKPALASPVAIIIAKPAKGYSPLKVNFSGQKSYSKSGKIIAYDWNFGDGDISNKKDPENTYWSTTYGSRNFTATLTVRDDAGNTSIASTIIEIITK